MGEVALPRSPAPYLSAGTMGYMDLALPGDGLSSARLSGPASCVPDGEWRRPGTGGDNGTSLDRAWQQKRPPRLEQPLGPSAIKGRRWTPRRRAVRLQARGRQALPLLLLPVPPSALRQQPPSARGRCTCRGRAARSSRCCAGTPEPPGKQQQLWHSSVSTEQPAHAGSLLRQA